MTKTRLYEIIEKGSTDDKPSLVFDYFIMLLIILNVVAIILESFNSFYLQYVYALRTFEVFSVIVFTIEYCLRLWTSNLKFPNKSVTIALFLYVLTPMALIDLVAVLPFYLPMIIAVDLRFLRMLRLLRALRVFKLNRYSNSMNMLARVLKNEKEKLLVTVFITVLLILIASTLMYYMESDIQPEAFPNIIAALWWAIATLTTVGYGDVYPITAMGKFLSGVIALLGIGLVALPTGILSSGFMNEIDDEKEEKKKFKYCPHCGEKIEEID